MGKRSTLQLSKEEIRSLTETTYEKIKQAILKGVLEPGSRISERELAQEMGVSTTTVKRALGLLAVEGLLDIRARRGTYVAFQPSGNPRETMMIRASLEGLAARFAAEKALYEDIEALEQQLKVMEYRTEKGPVSALVEANTEFHYLVHRIGKNPYIIRLIEILKSFDLNFRRKALSHKEEAQRGLAEHRSVFEAIRAHDGELAEHRMKAHIIRTYDQVTIGNR
ncbi:MAG: GntR family transcriptional regulator [Spirochaetes bacterium]|nr:GntR family transcriptional regulator [Spirochaetota bacterium]